MNCKLLELQHCNNDRAVPRTGQPMVPSSTLHYSVHRRLRRDGYRDLLLSAFPVYNIQESLTLDTQVTDKGRKASMFLRNESEPSTGSLPIFESWFACIVPEERLFGQLKPEVLDVLNSIRQTAFYPQGTVLFAEGESARGLFILSSGQAKLSTSLIDGKSIALRLIEAGEILALGSVVGNLPYPATVETTTPCRVDFIPRGDFLQFLYNHSELSVRVVEYLSIELQKAWGSLIALTPKT